MQTRLVVIPVLCLLAVTPVDAEEAAKPNTPPEGFTALFNGEDLTGWIGLPHFDPRKLREMTSEERSGFLEKNWVEVEKHWSVENGELVNDGEGPYLTTARDYGDFELRLDYKTVAKADSGIYLRGNPQVQIWDWTEEAGKWDLGADKGSGGLWNNKTHDRFPYVQADSPFGEWNSLKITMVGETVTVRLNDKLVVNETVMENYWDRTIPVFPLGPVQLQTHGGEIRFRNVFLREIDRKSPEAGFLDADGNPYGDGWKKIENVETGKPIAASESLRNFDLHATFRLDGDQSGEISFRAEGGADGPGLVLTVSPEHGILLSDRKEGKPHTVADSPAETSGLKTDGENHVYLRVHEDHVQAWLNDTQVIDVLYAHGPQTGSVRFSGMQVAASHVRNTAEDERVETFPGGEEGFTPIYNGKDLTGWTGDVNGYQAEPHVLVATKEGGNIYYDQELGDFVFRFEFKLEEGGNSGVGIRVPKDASATAYEGIESQILDNPADVYATIQPWQTHGSIYGVIPAKRGSLAPTGHWNQEEITVQGNRFKVVLNGKILLEGDVTPGKTADGKEHPGLANKTGRLGFLGHNHHIEFRNLRVKPLESK
ncbi:MAG: family 16 glycoside hydrolase [Planctomycetaceae bacterium]